MTEAPASSFSQLQLSRPLLKVHTAVRYMAQCPVTSTGDWQHGVQQADADSGPDHPHRTHGPRHLRMRRNRCRSASCVDRSVVLYEMRSSRAVVSCCTPQARVRQQPSCSPFLSVFYTVPNAFSRYVYQLLIACHSVMYCPSDQYIFTVDSHINADARAHTPADARVGRPVRRGC